MICKGCGSEIKEGNFCSECGIGMKNEETNINDKDNVEIVNIESKRHKTYRSEKSAC